MKQCADPSWKICQSGVGFCCLQGWTCYDQISASGDPGGVGCLTPGATLNSLQRELPTIAVSTTSPSSGSKVQVYTTDLSSAFNSPTTVISKVSVAAETAISSPDLPTTTSHVPSPTGLNTAERIGVGVGVSLGVLFLAIIALLTYILRRQTIIASQTRPKSGDHVPTDSNNNTSRHLPAPRPDVYNNTNKVNEIMSQGSEEPEYPTQQIHEMHGMARSSYPRELHGSPTPEVA